MNCDGRPAIRSPALPRECLRSMQDAGGLRQPLAVRRPAKWCHEDSRWRALTRESEGDVETRRPPQTPRTSWTNEGGR
jgi:hypothetical protein